MEIESLNKTWFVDIDGTILKHHTNVSLDNLIETYGEESYLHERPIASAIDFFKSRPSKDRIIIATAREKKHTDHTLKALKHCGMPFDDCIFDLGSGPRIVVNDIKPPGTAGNKDPVKTAYGMDIERDYGIEEEHLKFVEKIDKRK